MVADGLAKAYDLSRCGNDVFSGELVGMPSLDVPEEWFKTYFYITEAGRAVHRADDSWWPFEEDSDLLRPDWKRPED